MTASACSQVSLLQQQLQLRKQRGEVKKNAAGEVVDRESRVLLYQINNMMRPIQFDEEESSTLQDSKARYLLLALTNYHRFMPSDPPHPMPPTLSTPPRDPPLYIPGYAFHSSSL